MVVSLYLTLALTLLTKRIKFIAIAIWHLSDATTHKLDMTAGDIQ
jgi:hypothetical protein